MLIFNFNSLNWPISEIFERLISNDLFLVIFWKKLYPKTFLSVYFINPRSFIDLTSIHWIGQFLRFSNLLTPIDLFLVIFRKIYIPKFFSGLTLLSPEVTELNSNALKWPISEIFERFNPDWPVFGHFSDKNYFPKFFSG